MQDLDIFGLESGFFLNILLNIYKKSIRSSISFILIIIYPKIILK